MRLKDKTAIVTGAGSGFGKGIAMRFAKEGARVGVIDINAEAAREVASQIGDSAFAMEADVSICLLYTSPSPRDVEESRMPSSA